MDFVHKEQFAFALLDLVATAQPLASSEPTAKSSGSRSASQTVWQPRVIQPSPMRAIPLTRPTESFHVQSDPIFCYDSDNDFTSSSSSDDDEADDFCSAFRPLNLQPICSYERGFSPVYPTSTLADEEDFYPTSSGAINAVSSPPHSFLVLLEAAETFSSSPRKSIKAPVPQGLFEDPSTSALVDKLDELILRESTLPTSEPIVAYKQLPASFYPEEAGYVSSPNLLTVEQSTREEADLFIHFTASFSHSPSRSPGSPVLSTSTDPLSSLEPTSIKNSPIDWFTETEEEAPWSEECMFPTSGIRDSALSNPEADYIHPSKDLLLVQEESVYTEDAAKCSLHVIEEEEEREEEEEEEEDKWEEESEQYGEDFVVELYDSDTELEADFGAEEDEEEEGESESDSDSDDEPIHTPRYLRVRIDLVDWSFDSESNSSFDNFDENPYTVHTVTPHLVLTPPTEPEAENAGQEAVNPPLQSVKYLVVPKNTFKSPKPPHAPPGRPVSSVHGAKDESSDDDDEVVVEEEDEREEDKGEAAVAVTPIHVFDDDIEGVFDEEYEGEPLADTTPADATEVLVVVDAEAAAEEIAPVHDDLPFWDVDEEVTEVQESIIAHDALRFWEVDEEATDIQESVLLTSNVSKGADEVEGASATEVLSVVMSLPLGELEEATEVKDTAKANESGKVPDVLPSTLSWVYEVYIRKRLMGADNEVLLVEEVEVHEISDQFKAVVSTSKAMESLSIDSSFDNTTSHPPSMLTSSFLPQKRSCSYPADAPAPKRCRIDKDDEDVANMLSSPQWSTPVVSDLNTSSHEEDQPVFIPSHAFSLSFDVLVKQEVVEEVASVYAPLPVSKEELVDAQAEEAPLLSSVTSVLTEDEPSSSPPPLPDITLEDGHRVLNLSPPSRKVNIIQEVNAVPVTSHLPILDLPPLPCTAASSSRELSDQESQASSTVQESSSGFDIPSFPSTTASALEQPKLPKRRAFLLPPPVLKQESRESAQEAIERLARRAVVLEAQQEEMAWSMTEEDGLDFQRWNRRDPVERIIRRRQKLGRKDSYRRSYGKRRAPESITPTAPSVVGQGLPISHLIGIGLLILVPTIVNIVVQVFMTSFDLSKLKL